jgi:hypothetical protein
LSGVNYENYDGNVKSKQEKHMITHVEDKQEDVLVSNIRKIIEMSKKEEFVLTIKVRSNIPSKTFINQLIENVENVDDHIFIDCIMDMINKEDINTNLKMALKEHYINTVSEQ